MIQVNCSTVTWAHGICHLKQLYGHPLECAVIVTEKVVANPVLVPKMTKSVETVSQVAWEDARHSQWIQDVKAKRGCRPNPHTTRHHPPPATGGSPSAAILVSQAWYVNDTSNQDKSCDENCEATTLISCRRKTRLLSQPPYGPPPLPHLPLVGTHQLLSWLPKLGR